MQNNERKLLTLWKTGREKRKNDVIYIRQNNNKMTIRNLEERSGIRSAKKM
jgi:hypothetical protein